MIRRWWHRRSLRRHCPHSDLLPVYGDAINQFGGFRLWCRDCGSRINGPVTLAHLREHEQERAAAEARR